MIVQPRLSAKFLASFVVLVTAACSSNGSGTSGATSDDETGGDAPCTAGPSRSLSESCCPSLGVDACGAMLFCAAFDGRTTATCYPERSRPDQGECSADVQCMSGSCNTDASRCRSLYGQKCSAEIGCAPGPDGTNYACDPSTNTCRPVSPEDGGLCAADGDCASRHCVRSRCSSGKESAPCAKGDDCLSGLCVGSRCSTGTLGGSCGGDADCTVGGCVGGRCVCRGASDCTTDKPHCVSGACYQGWYGDPCALDADCNVKYPHCKAGKCDAGTKLGDPCTATAQCAAETSRLGKAVRVLCDPTKHTCVIAASGICQEMWSADICPSGYSCKPSTTNAGKCGSSTGPGCSGAYCCDSKSCSVSCYDGLNCLP